MSRQRLLKTVLLTTLSHPTPVIVMLIGPHSGTSRYRYQLTVREGGV